jgi:NAD(P)-dependent dehydrogenase (short-subunit alcohol dehydrogenase family)
VAAGGTVHKTHAGKVAVVTGSSRGIGQALTQRFAERGAKVVGVDLLDQTDTAGMVAKAGGQFLAVRADLTSESQVAAAAASTKEQFGHADIVVNCAGIYPRASWDELDYASWKHVMCVNLDSQFLMCKAFVPQMRARTYGRIINFVSGIVQMPLPQFTAYRTSKAACIGLTRSLAADLGEFGITVNAVSPSFVITPGVLEVGNAHMAPQIIASQSIKRQSTPNDIAGLVLFLSSDEAEFITGQTMYADGGLLNR